MSGPIIFEQSKLIQLIQNYALEFGNFQLASGKTANFYLDCRRLTLSGEGANQIAAGMIRLLDDDWPDAVGGMAIGADPITAAVITVAWQQGKPLRGFIVRKEAKAHGKNRQVEGPIEPGDRAVILEDVVTTGGSSIKAIGHARQAGLVVDRVIAVIDRLEGAEKQFAAHGIRLDALATIDDLNLDGQ